MANGGGGVGFRGNCGRNGCERIDGMNVDGFKQTVEKNCIKIGAEMTWILKKA
jgi:hypothetical protein